MHITRQQNEFSNFFILTFLQFKMGCMELATLAFCFQPREALIIVWKNATHKKPTLKPKTNPTFSFNADERNTTPLQLLASNVVTFSRFALPKVETVLYFSYQMKRWICFRLYITIIWPIKQIWNWKEMSILSPSLNSFHGVHLRRLNYIWSCF